MSEEKQGDFLSWENLIYIADFLQAAGENRFSLLGGEPTLHPDFNDFVLYLLERNFNIHVFTSGVMEDEKLRESEFLFRDLPLERLSFTCNINDPQMTGTSLAENQSVKRFFRFFGPRIVPGFNIYKKDFDLTFLIKYINEFGLQRNMRVGIAHPIPRKRNRFISIDDIGLVTERLFSYIPMFERFRIKPGLDCGFLLCRIGDDHLAWLYRFTGGNSQFGCGPVVDIGPDMSVWPCFPLASFHKKSLFDFNSMQEVLDYYKQIHDVVHIEVGGIFDECDDCQHREDGFCQGGCIAHSVARFQEEAPIRMKEAYL
jgi:radical SAM protein with 4Fe4S-binding SPASM domain